MHAPLSTPDFKLDAPGALHAAHGSPFLAELEAEAKAHRRLAKRARRQEKECESWAHKSFADGIDFACACIRAAQPKTENDPKLSDCCAWLGALGSDCPT